MDGPAPTLEVRKAATPERALWLRFLRFWLVGVAVLLLGVAGLNAAVDPFFVFGTPLIPGFNQYKPATQGREVLAKLALLPRMQPRTVLIGTSKVQVGLDPNFSVWGPEDRPVFNDGLPGNTSPATLAVLEDALAVAPVRRVLVFFEPMSLLEPGVPFTPAEPFRHTGWARAQDLLDASLTRDALDASITTLAEQWTGLPSGLRPNGQMYDGIFRGPTLAEGPGALFGQKAVQNSRDTLRLVKRIAAQPGAPIANLDVVRRIIALCRDKGVAVDLALAPLHADFLRLFDLAGLWPRYLLMREELAQTVAEAGGGKVRLWSFTGFDAYSTEPVPPLGLRAPLLRWFWEPSHFRPEYGQLLLEAIYRGREGVGTLLTPADAAALNQAQTSAMEADRAAQPAEWARVADALAKAEAAGQGR